MLVCIAVMWGTFFIRTGRTDLSIFIDAANRLSAGLPVYDLSQANEHTKPPLATLLFIPLTALPMGFLCRLWDLLVVLAYAWLAWSFTKERTRQGSVGLALLGVLWTLNNWNQEIRLGQYNVLTLAGLWWATQTNRARFAGSVAALCVLLKPTNLFFIPLLLALKKGNRTNVIFGAAALVLGVSAVYAGRFGVSALLQHHLDWFHFLSASTAKHFLRHDNYSLLKAIADFMSVPFLLWAVRGVVAGILLWVALLKSDRFTRFTLTAVLSLFLNPLCWFQNFTLLLPFAILIWHDALQAKRREKFLLYTSLAFLYAGMQLFNPALCHLSPAVWAWCVRPLPLYFLLLSCAAFFAARRSTVGSSSRSS